MNEFRTLSFVLPAADENALLDQVTKEIGDEFTADIERAFPDYLMPAMQSLGPRERLARYVLLTAPENFDLIMDEDYVEKFQQGLVLPPVPDDLDWLGILSLPDLWKETAADFRRLHRARVENA